MSAVFRALDLPYEELDSYEETNMSASVVSRPIGANVPASASLKPKEHGAYAILAIPIVSALMITGASVVGLLVAGAALAGFLAHEPLLVAIGHRGNRARQSAPAAGRRLAVLLAVTVICGLAAVIGGSAQVRWSLVGCGLLAAVSFAQAIAGRHRTLGGQLLGVVGLSAPCVPILLAGSVPATLALEVWLTWVIGFTGTTMAVRSVIASQKRHSRVIHWAAAGLLSIGTAVLLAVGFKVPIVVLPMLLMSWALLLFPPPAKKLRRVGWILVAGTIASALWLVAAV